MALLHLEPDPSITELERRISAIDTADDATSEFEYCIWHQNSIFSSMQRLIASAEADKAARDKNFTHRISQLAAQQMGNAAHVNLLQERVRELGLRDPLPQGAGKEEKAARERLIAVTRRAEEVAVEHARSVKTMTRL